MEYIKKEELKYGDIFVVGSFYRFINKEGTPFSISERKKTGIATFSKNNGFMYENARMATPEEKHWLESCVKLDKFITFEEAMKTFIPEYVECIQTSTDRFTKNKIYKVEDKGYVKTFVLLDDKNINTILSGIHSLYTGTVGYKGLSNSVLMKAQVFPDNMLYEEATNTLIWFNSNRLTFFGVFLNLFLTKEELFRRDETHKTISYFGGYHLCIKVAFFVFGYISNIYNDFAIFKSWINRITI